MDSNHDSMPDPLLVLSSSVNDSLKDVVLCLLF